MAALLHGLVFASTLLSGIQGQVVTVPSLPPITLTPTSTSSAAGATTSTADVSCPESNNQNTDDFLGNAYHIACNYNFGRGDDLDPTSNAVSFKNCIDDCTIFTRTNPLGLQCQGVTYNPTANRTCIFKGSQDNFEVDNSTDAAVRLSFFNGTSASSSLSSTSSDVLSIPSVTILPNLTSTSTSSDLISLPSITILPNLTSTSDSSTLTSDSFTSPSSTLSLPSTSSFSSVASPTASSPSSCSKYDGSIYFEDVHRDNYAVSCQTFFNSGDNGTIQGLMATFEECIDSCSDYNAIQGAEVCKGILYYNQDPDVYNGDRCYLRSAAESPFFDAAFDAAILITSASSTQTSTSPATSTSPPTSTSASETSTSSSLLTTPSSSPSITPSSSQPSSFITSTQSSNPPAQTSEAPSNGCTDACTPGAVCCNSRNTFSICVQNDDGSASPFPYGNTAPGTYCDARTNRIRANNLGDCPIDNALSCPNENTIYICDHGGLISLGRTADGTKCVDGRIVYA